MSAVSKNSLRSSLLQLECYFTWTLLKQDVELDELEERLGHQHEFFTKSRITICNLLSYISHLKGSNEKALAHLQKAEEEIKRCHPEEIGRRSIVTWGNYAWVYYHMERYEDAQRYVSKVENTCKELPSTPQLKAQFPEICAEEGWALMKFGKKYFGRAKVCFEDALQREPDNPEFNAGYAITVYRLECPFNSHGQALQLLQRAVELDPENTFIVVLLALKLQDMQRTEEGERYIKAALKQAPALPYTLRYAAKFYRRKGEVGKAVELLRKALAVTPNPAILHHQLAVCYRSELNQLREAVRYPPAEQVDKLIQLSISHFKAAIDKNPKFFFCHMDLAKMYVEAKRYEEAEEIFQKAFQINILSHSDKQLLHYLYASFKHFDTKEEPEAIEHYLEALKAQKSSLYFAKCRDALKRLLEQRIQRGSRDATDFGRLGFVYHLCGDTQEAIRRYKQALALHPDNEEYLSALCELRLSISS
ncbi:interferon-induced protein with tetratricopeptide repeats 5 [Dryobates pubescens]|uniref:interferon-induced protein with tetratricopeptide repeats 5 n=1 Tax=Dryobates pubescens TaxID=118200 RepID=UPI0023B8C665|nr:interferon-induced protein with tetratricopeptide repeats 5 [Dryobates pubescens]